MTIPPARDTVLGLTVPAVLLLAFACACSTAPETGASAPSPRPSASTAVSSAVSVPSADPTDPRAVAAAFVVGWSSYDSQLDTPASPAARVAHLVTPQLAGELTLTAPDRSWRGQPREVSVLRVVKVFVPEGAPAPATGLAYYTVVGQRITTGNGHPRITVDGLSVELVHDAGRWQVNQIFFY